MYHPLSGAKMTLRLICLAVAISACVPIQPQISYQATATLPAQVLSPSQTMPTLIAAATPDNWQSRWLQGIPCRPPCWEGITPGHTTAREALKVLNAGSLATGAVTKTWNFRDGYVIWEWNDTLKGGQARYDINSPTQTIYLIDPYLKTSFRLQDVIQSYGQPSHVAISARRNPDINSGFSYDVRIIYQAQGFILVKGATSKPTLDVDIRFGTIFFFAPDERGYFAALGGVAEHLDWILPWQGLQSFDFYCRDEENGRACRGEP